MFKNLASGIIISFISVLISLLISEGIARIYLPPPLLVNLKQISQQAPSQIADSQSNSSGVQRAVKADLTLSYYGSGGHRYRPNVSAVVENDTVSSRTIEYKTNSLGLLDKEIAPKAKADDKRILFIGDSITAGVGAMQEERFTNQLSLKHSQNSNSIEFVNAGISGLNAEESFLHYAEITEKVSPDVVVFNLYLNDANNTRLFLSTVPPYPYSESYLISWFINSSKILKEKIMLSTDSSYEKKLKWREEFRAGRTFEPQIWQGESFITSKEAFDNAIDLAFLDWGLGWSDVAWDEIAQTLRAFKALTQKNKQKFIVLLSPVSYQVYSTIEDFRPNQFFRNVCNDIGVECIDLLPELRSRYQQNKQSLFYDQCHFNPTGHKVVADILEKELVSKLLQN